MNTTKHDTEGMSPWTHRGITYWTDDAEMFYTPDGVRIGYICTRGALYALGIVDDDDNTLATANGRMDTIPEDDGDDPVLDQLLKLRADWDNR
jgi:hypothetical protein